MFYNEEVWDTIDRAWETGWKEGRDSMIEIVKYSLKKCEYEYDEKMTVDENIESAMSMMFANGYMKGVCD